MTAYPPFASTALVIAHPAHELRVLGWMARARPMVSVLTTGSRNGHALDRLTRTGELVDAAGCRRGGLFGASLDRDLYGAIMHGDIDRFRDWTGWLAEDFVDNAVELVVADGWQGYSPAHDLVHVMARLAAARAARALGRPVRVVEYAVAPEALTPLHADASPAFSIALDEGEAAAKAAAIATYPDIAVEAAEIEGLEGAPRLAAEHFFLPAPLGTLLRPQTHLAYYERIGEQRVAQGLYREVLRESQVTTVARALMAQAAEVEAPLAQVSLA